MSGLRDDVRRLLAVVAVALVATSCTSEGGGGSRAQEPAGGGEVATVSLPAGAAQRCMVPSPEVLARADLAVDGTVAAIEGDRVTLAVSHAYAGGPVEQVEVAQASRSRQALILGVRFEEGGRYLVAAVDGDVMVCGFSGPHDRRLARLYDRAFTTE